MVELVFQDFQLVSKYLISYICTSLVVSKSHLFLGSKPPEMADDRCEIL